jgi:hypothetical protein
MPLQFGAISPKRKKGIVLAAGVLASGIMLGIPTHDDWKRLQEHASKLHQKSQEHLKKFQKVGSQPALQEGPSKQERKLNLMHWWRKNTDQPYDRQVRAEASFCKDLQEKKSPDYEEYCGENSNLRPETRWMADLCVPSKPVEFETPHCKEFVEERRQSTWQTRLKAVEERGWESRKQEEARWCDSVKKDSLLTYWEYCLPEETKK